MQRSPHRAPAIAVAILVLASSAISGCGIGRGYEGLPSGVVASGGDGTVVAEGAGAFGNPAANLDSEQVARFRVGDTFFTLPWDPAPGSSPERDGLGPTFLAASCAACHPADGVGDSPGVPSDSGSPIVRFSDASGVATATATYGFQIQTRSIDGVPREGSLEFTWTDIPGRYADGTPFSLRQPGLAVEWGVLGPPAEAFASGLVVAPKLIGLGLLEAIPAQDIAAGADPGDDDGDGISGRVSLVDSPSGPVLGRFGRKATQPTVADQVAIAYWRDLGITSPSRPFENCPTPQSECAAAVTGGTPEISEARLRDVVFYTQVLAVPARASAGDASVLAGEVIFDSLGCSACHVAVWRTGTHEIRALADQIIHPYTDLLLHDMGDGLSDGRADGAASPTEWRTAALWGLGLTQAVNPDAGFLHDGRARTIEEAVLWHGGEAQRSRDAFTKLSRLDRERVVTFLKSL